jgi:hypothetical protein
MNKLWSELFGAYADAFEEQDLQSGLDLEGNTPAFQEAVLELQCRVDWQQDYASASRDFVQVLRERSDACGE